MSENARPKDETKSGGMNSGDDALGRRRDVLFNPGDDDAILLDPMDLKMIEEVGKVTKWWDELESEISEPESKATEQAPESVEKTDAISTPSNDHRKSEVDLLNAPNHHPEVENSDEAERSEEASTEESQHPGAREPLPEKPKPSSPPKPATSTWEDSLENEALFLPDWADEVAESLPQIELIGSLTAGELDASAPPLVEEKPQPIPLKKTAPPPLPVPTEPDVVATEGEKEPEASKIADTAPAISPQPPSLPVSDPLPPQWEDSFQIQTPLIPTDTDEEVGPISLSHDKGAKEAPISTEGTSDVTPPWGITDVQEAPVIPPRLADPQSDKPGSPPTLPESFVEPPASSDESLLPTDLPTDLSTQSDESESEVSVLQPNLGSEVTEPEASPTSDLSADLADSQTVSVPDIGEAPDLPISEVNELEEAISEENTKIAPEPDAHPEQSAPTPKSNVKHHRAGCLSVFATSYLIASLLVLLLLAGVVTYAWLQREALSAKFTQTVVDEWKIDGIRIVPGACRYDFAHGAVFNDLSFYRGPADSDLLAKITKVSAAIDPVDLIATKPRLKARELSLRDSSITLYEKGKSLTVIQGVDARIHLDTNRLGIDRLSGVIGNLRLRIDGAYDLASGVSSSGASAPSALSWSSLAPLLPWLQVEAEGARLPTLSLSFSGKSGAAPSLSVTGNLEGYGDLRWRGVALKSIAISGEWDSTSGILRIPHAQVACGGGIVSAVLGVDWKKRVLGIERFESSADLAQVLPSYNAEWSQYFSHLRFVDSPLLRIAGTLSLDDPKNATLELVYTHRGGLEILSGERKLPLEDIRGRLVLHNQGVLETKDLAATLYGGQVQVAASVNLVREETPFVGFLKMASVPAESMAPWMGKVGTGLTGGLNLTYKGSGSLNQGLSHLTGNGTLLIENAVAAKLPIFGPVRTLAGRLVPILMGEEKGSVDASYQIESGVLITSDLTLRSGRLKIQTTGNVPLESQDVTFTAKVGLDSGIAAMVGLKDQVIYVDGKGPIDAPALTLSHFPIDFARVDLGGVLGTTSDTLAGLKELLPKEKRSSVLAAPEDGSKIHIFASVMEILKENDEAEAPQPVLRAVPNE